MMIQGFITSSILFFSNILLMYNIFSWNNIDDPLEMVTYFWLELTFLANMSKLLYCFNKEAVYKGTLYLVNNNLTLATCWLPLTSLLPWNYLLLFLGDYIANCDREYTFIINNWGNILYYLSTIFILTIIAIYNFIFGYYYTSFIILIGCFQLISTILYLSYYVDKYLDEDSFVYVNILLYSFAFIISFIETNYIKIILLFQIINTIIYTTNYLDETYVKKGSVNKNSKDFQAGTWLINRPLFYLNILQIVVPSYILITL